MSVLVIWSSPNQDGLTAAAKEAVLAGLKAAGTEAEAVQLNKLKLGHCCACGSGRGWGSCRKEGTCWMDDDFQGLYEKMRAADGVVFVTAVWTGSAAATRGTTTCSRERRRCSRPVPAAPARAPFHVSTGWSPSSPTWRCRRRTGCP